MENIHKIFEKGMYVFIAPEQKTYSMWESLESLH